MPTAEQNVLKTEKDPTVGSKNAVENVHRLRVGVTKPVHLNFDRINEP